MDTDLLLKQYGLKYENLNDVERATFHNMVNEIKAGALTLERLRERITDMRESVITEVSNYENGSKQDIFCKARIRNYTLILALFLPPEKAMKALGEALERMK